MSLTFLGAVVSGLVVERLVGTVSFVAFVNFTAGVWVRQSIYSLGNAGTGDDDDGVAGVIRDTAG